MYRHTEVDGRDIEPETHVRSLARTDLVAVGILLGDARILYAAQPERNRRTDVGEDVYGSSRVERQLYLRFVVVGAVGCASFVMIRVVCEARMSRRERQLELGEEPEASFGVEPQIGRASCRERV